ncbi:LLM class flavin-dependent oxidoreductase [Streptomyces sp. NPDC088354]|uniref:LLM class flavin-dependent oxidoreductase n=1 Tax=Streptomyces sp. NPDC088354 TaxID=3365856 RepID=UPI00382273BE
MSTDRITSLAFLTPGNFDDEDPHTGLEETLRLFEYGERLGFDGAWVRQRHLEHGVGSAAVFLAAAAQRTRRVELGTAVIPIGYESPFRLAEDLSLADVLSQGRLQAGFSTGMPHAELLGDLVYDGDWRSFDLSYGRIARLVDNLRGRWLGGPDTVIRSPGAIQRPRLQPHNPGLTDRIWYGAGSLTSVRWAAEHGLHLLSGNIVSADGDTDDFTSAQLRMLSEYRRTARGPPGGTHRPGARRRPVRQCRRRHPDPLCRLRRRPAPAHTGAADHRHAADPLRPGPRRDRGPDPGTAHRGPRARVGVGTPPRAAVRVPSRGVRADPARRTTPDRAGTRVAARPSGRPRPQPEPRGGGRALNDRPSGQSAGQGLDRPGQAGSRGTLSISRRV